jgi:hypothetical protein
MSTQIHSSNKPRMHRPSLERSLKLLLESKASSAVIRADLSGQAADGWHNLLRAAKPLGLTQDQLLGLLIRHSYASVLKAIERELEAKEAPGASHGPQQG